MLSLLFPRARLVIFALAGWLAATRIVVGAHYPSDVIAGLAFGHMFAVLAALVAAQKPADILFLVSAAFSFAAAGFFPALVMGIFWKRATGVAATLGMIAGFGITFYYMVTTQPWLRGIFGVTSPVELWFGIQPISAGVFGVPLGFAVIILVSLVTPAPKKEVQELVEHVRYPNLKAA